MLFMLGLRIKLFLMSYLGWFDRLVMHSGTILTFLSKIASETLLDGIDRSYEEEVTPLVGCPADVVMKSYCNRPKCFATR